jgi:hypothetical protein
MLLEGDIRFRPWVTLMGFFGFFGDGELQTAAPGENGGCTACRV